MLKYYLVVLIASATAAHKNNVCKRFVDYATIGSNKNCWYNPDLDADMPELVTQHGYSLENYTVTTTDGYISEIYRLPRNNSKGVVFLVHNAFSSCTVWLDKGYDNSLAYILYNQGYDVWLSNLRGTYLARRHVYLKPSERQFWDFSYHEMAIYDIPAQINQIKSITKTDKLTFISHSLGSTVAAIYASLLKDHAVENVSGFILMAPAVYFKHIRTPLKFLVPFASGIYDTLNFLNIEELFPHNSLTINLLKMCRIFPTVGLCAAGTNFLLGPGLTDASLTPVVSFQATAGMSTKMVYHYAQNVHDSESFRQFDYGRKLNNKHYGSRNPPKYPIETIRSKFYIFSGDKDAMVHPKDADYFYNKLPSASQIGIETIKGFNHANFAYAPDLHGHIYGEITELLNQNVFGN